MDNADTMNNLLIRIEGFFCDIRHHIAELQSENSLLRMKCEGYEMLEDFDDGFVEIPAIRRRRSRKHEVGVMKIGDTMTLMVGESSVAKLKNSAHTWQTSGRHFVARSIYEGSVVVGATLYRTR